MTCVPALKAIINYQLYKKEEGKLIVTVSYDYETEGVGEKSFTDSYYMKEKNFTERTAEVGGGKSCNGSRTEWKNRVKFTETWGKVACGQFTQATENNLAVQANSSIYYVTVTGFYYSRTGDSCDKQESNKFSLEKPITAAISVIPKDNCIEIFLDNNLIKTFCSDANCPPPDYSIECDPVECPDGTCCECLDGDYKCCYNGQGVVIKRFRIV